MDCQKKTGQADQNKILKSQQKKREMSIAMIIWLQIKFQELEYIELMWYYCVVIGLLYCVACDAL